MSYCREEGKDKIIFVTESDHTQPSTVALPDIEDEAEYEGLIKANGEINWECPCLGGMATGVCGEQFRSAFSCFHMSQSEPKGSECIEQFRTMQECFKNYPEIYGEFENVDEEEKDDKELFNGENDKELDGEIGEEMVGRKELDEVKGEKMDGEKMDGKKGRKVEGTSSKDSKEAEQKSESKTRTVKSS